MKLDRRTLRPESPVRTALRSARPLTPPARRRLRANATAPVPTPSADGQRAPTTPATGGAAASAD